MSFRLEFNNGELVRARTTPGGGGGQPEWVEVDPGNPSGPPDETKKGNLKVEDIPTGTFQDVTTITIVKTNPCCWVRIGNRYVCLPC